jgi:hypothetical protein
MALLPGRVRIHRSDSLGFDRFCTLLILIDGVKAGTLGPDEYLLLTPPAGTHELSAKVDWKTQGSLTIEVRDGEESEYEICDGAGNWGLLLSVLNVVLPPHHAVGSGALAIRLVNTQEI